MGPDCIDTELASVMRAKRLSLGMSLEKLSSRLGLSTDELCAIEGADSDPDIGLLAAAAHEFGIESSLLMEQAEQLQDAPIDIRGKMFNRTVATQRQLNLIERQHYSMVKQLASILRQLNNLKDCSVPDGQGDRLKDLEARIVLHSERLIMALQRLKATRKACEEIERFVLKARRNRLNVVFTQLPH